MSHTKQSISKKSSNPVILNLIENQSKYKKYLSAFTLVELIVVIVILAILATIAFLSFNSYSSSSRDSVRLADISNIAKGLTLQYTIGGYYILPDNSVSLYSGSTIIGYQGKAGSNTLNTIKLSANTNNTSGRDPIDNTYYTYNTNINKNRYQVTGYLENKGTIINRTSSINNLTNQTYATTYTNRFPYTKGDSIGVILNYTGTTSNPIYTPIEDITTSTGIDISSGTLTNGKVVISNNTDSSTGVSTQTMSGYTAVNTLNNGPKPDGTAGNPGLSCNDLKTNGGINVDGIYYIKPSGSATFQTYCDMTTDGGGWTLAGIQVPTNTFTVDSTGDINISNFGSITNSWRMGNAKIQSFIPTIAWKLQSRNTANNNIVDTGYFKPTCIINWTITRNGTTNTMPLDCQIAYTNTTFSSVLGGTYMTANTSIGIGQNNNGGYCSMRMGSSGGYYYSAYNCTAQYGVDKILLRFK